MPIYEYECLSCGTRTERIQKLSDPPLSTCPACGGEVKKLISSPAFQFKGSGWYVTDYAGKSSGGKGTGGESKSSDGGKSDKAGAAESSTKPEKVEKAEKKASSSDG